MKIKATKKILSLVLAVMMVMSTFAMMFVNAEDAPATDAPVTTPKAYASAADGEKLYDVDFSSQYYTFVDDTKMAFDNNGQTYMPDGEPQSNDPADNKDKNGDGKVAGYGADSYAFLNGWRKAVTADATIADENGAALKIDFADNDVDSKGAKLTDTRQSGYINAYSLENSTYTYEFEYFRKGVVRSKFYFANGSFMNFGGCDYYMPTLGIEFNATGCRLMRQSSACAGTTGAPIYKTNEAGETTSIVKVVLEGGAKIEDVTLYSGKWTTPTENAGYWTGDVIPVKFTIYSNYVAADGTVKDIRLSTGEIYQPADIGLVFGIGEYNKLADGQYYGARNLALYKGDTSIAYKSTFAVDYETKGWGATITEFDAKGISDPAFNYANGYEWVNQGSTVADAEGVITINRTDKGATQGAYTGSPLQDQWNTGIYEMELTINNASRLKVGLISVKGTLDRIGFNVLPNVANANLAEGSKDAYLHADAQNAATLWTSAANSFGTGIVEKSTPAIAPWIKTIVYDTYVADAKDIPNPEYDASVEGSQEFIGDGVPEDPRLVRDFGGNRANIKIVFNTYDSIITYYEKVDSEWTAISAIDYSGATEAGVALDSCIDFQAYNANTNATIKNVKIVKGSSAQHLHTFQIADYTTDVIYKGFAQDVIDAFTADYAAANGLWGSDWGWSADGATIVDFEAAYNALDEQLYGPQNIKLVPIVTYDELVEGVAVRGIKVAEGENNKYDVTFVGALAGDLAQYNAVGFEIVKVTEIGGKFITTTEYVESNEVYETIKANGLDLTAAAVGGNYIFTATLAGEKAAEGINVDYIVTPYTIDVDGVKNVAIDSYTFSFIDGEYAPLG